MQGSKQDIEIDEDITYSLVSDSFNKALKLTNKSPHIYVFKIKTNQRSVISMQVTHDFIKANSVKDIVIRLAEKPSESTPLRLELNYVIPTEEEIRINDSKMNSYGRDAVFRRVITISRDDSAKSALTSSTSFRKDETSVPEQASISLSAVLLKEEKKEEKREVKEVKEAKREEKQARRQEKEQKKEVKRVEKEERRAAQSQHPSVPSPIKYPDLSYIRQVESEQIEIITGKSTEIDVSGLISVVEAPSSSEEAISAYSNPIEVANKLIEAVKSQVKPVINIANLANTEREDVFINAPSSPSKKSQTLEKKSRSEEERSLAELKQKLEREQATINKLKYEQTATLRSDCVYPVPIVYLIVLLAFLSGAVANWIVV